MLLALTGHFATETLRERFKVTSKPHELNVRFKFLEATPLVPAVSAADSASAMAIIVAAGDRSLFTVTDF